MAGEGRLDPELLPRQIFGIFALANALLLGALLQGFSAGRPQAPTGVVLSLTGVVVALVWAWLQSRVGIWQAMNREIVRDVRESYTLPRISGSAAVMVWGSRLSVVAWVLLLAWSAGLFSFSF